LYLEDGENVVVVATQGGMSTYPLWYKNMLANPKVECQVGANKGWYEVRRATADEELRLWPPLDDMYEGYAEYRARINGRREVPVMILEPSSTPG
jgi:deazaflavin-dependent oxidoreductase (nitroreductase family)